MTRPRRPSRQLRLAAPQSRSLTPAQRRLVWGWVLVVLGGISLIAAVHASGPALDGWAQAVWDCVGVGWPLPVGIAIAGGAVLLLDRVPALPRWRVAAGVIAWLAVLGLLAIVNAPWGGVVGVAVATLALSLGPLGGMFMLVALLAGATSGAVGARWLRVAIAVGRVTWDERHRLAAVVGGIHRPWSLQPVGSATPRAASTALVEVGTRASADRPGAPQSESVMARTETPGDDPATHRDGGEGRGDEWTLPPRDLLEEPRAPRARREGEIQAAVRTIEGTLATFGVQARVVGVNAGPAVTQYELQPAAGVQVRRVVSLQNDLSLALAASPLRIEAPIPGKSAIGIEVPNRKATLVSIREGVEAAGFQGGRHVLGVVLGNDVAGTPVSADLTRMPHLLIAGATGQGKSVCLNTMVCSLLLQLDPAQLRLLMIDPKRVELQGYNGLPHLAVPVIVEPHQAAAALRWAVEEMERRYRLLMAEGVRNVAALNARAAAGEQALPHVVLVIDELADLMMVAAGEVEELICRIAQKARAVGIHLVIATQRPSRDIITGLIAANVPSRIAFAVGSQVDSRVILDAGGAEKLVGSGDMLYQPVGASRPTRLQGAYISDREVEDLVGFWKAQGEPSYLEGVLTAGPDVDARDGEPARRLDPLFARAARAVAAEGAASVSLIQRKFNVGYSRAGRLVDSLAEHRVIGGHQGSRSREVLMTLPDVDELLERLGAEGEGSS